MPTSEARIQANKLNSAKSTGPKTEEGKAQSRRNGLKHGMTGQGIVVPEATQPELDQRHQDLQAELAPRSVLGAILVGQMAILSIRMEQGATQEFAAVASNVRNAADNFDLARLNQAEELMNTLGENPRSNLRRLKKSPEGINLLVEAWTELRLDLIREGKAFWTSAKLVLAANLIGLREDHARCSRIGALSRAICGDFLGLSDRDGEGLSEEARKAWARGQLFERIDQEIAELQEDFQEIDFATIAQDRAEAGSRALFDPSKEASLARRYESEARRGFFKAMKEFRQVELEAATRPGPPASDSAHKTYGTLASSCEIPGPGLDDLDPGPIEWAPLTNRPKMSQAEVVPMVDGRLPANGQAIPVPA